MSLRTTPTGTDPIFHSDNAQKASSDGEVSIRVLPCRLDFSPLQQRDRVTRTRDLITLPEKRFPSTVDCISGFVLTMLSIYILTTIRNYSE